MRLSRATARLRRRSPCTRTALAIVGVALLVWAEFSAVAQIVIGSLETEKRAITGGANHGYVLIICPAPRSR
ncbi:hypothetical protein BH20ACT16_BH20ACT16_06800 [soil metagenome]